jgi:phospholipase/lecithinase/hemolysin
VLASNPACGATTGLVCAPADLVAPNAEQTHLWSDPNHLTTAGQTIESDLMYDVITAPSQISLLARLSQLAAKDPSNDRFSGVWCRKVGTTAWAVIMLPEYRLL